jgi:glycerol uptake facilitator-like aquaporin
LVAGASNAILLSLFIFAAGPVSGGHLNPTITIATFLSRLSTFPRAVLYVAFQVGGAGLGGLLVRASLDTRNVSLHQLFPSHSLIFYSKSKLILGIWVGSTK